MAVNTSIVNIGAAKQSAKGTVPADPTFAHGVNSGAFLSLEITQNEDETTSGNPIAPAVIREDAKSGSKFTSRAYGKSLGLWLLGALGSCSTTGTTTKTHVFTRSGALPYLYLPSKLDGNIIAVKDCKIDEFKFGFDGPKACEIDVTAIGSAISWPASFVPTVDDTEATYFTPVGGSLKLDIDGTTLAEMEVTKGDVTIKNNVATGGSAISILPSRVDEDTTQVDVNMTVNIDDLSIWRTLVTGTSNGTSVAGVPVYGSYQWDFVNSDGSTLRIASTKTAFMCSLPEAKSGQAVANLVGKSVGTGALTVTLTNTQASY